MANSDLTKDTAKTFSQLSLKITNFLSDPPAGTPPEVKDALKTLKAQSDTIANTLAVKTIENAIEQLKQPAEKIKEATKKLNAAIKAIKERDKALDTAANLVNPLSSLVTSLKSGDLTSIKKTVGELLKKEE